MQIVIPMSGIGKRFMEAGYDRLKPLILVHGKPIIEWVLNMFPDEDDVLFICREEHLEQTELANELKRIKPSGRIVGIPGHKKGPVFAVMQAIDSLSENKPIIVSYCDYYMHWDYKAFKALMIERNCEGAVPCYTGFHPNLIPEKNLYASCKVDDNYDLIEIREKFSFAKDKTQALHSPGVYYFKNKEIIKKYFNLMMEKDLSIKGEYYVSLVYNLLVQDGLNVHVPVNVKHFCQWGTPEDMQDYLYWVNIVKSMKQL